MNLGTRPLDQAALASARPPLSAKTMAGYEGVLLSGNGTADGDYDFGGTLGAASGGYRKLNDKLLISDFLASLKSY